MRLIMLLVVAVAGCGPGIDVLGGGPPSYNPPANCTPVMPSLTALAIGHADGRPYAVGDALDTSRGGQGLTMAHFTVLMTGSVPDCVAPSVTADNHADYNAHNPTPVDGGAKIEEYLGPIDPGGAFTIDASSGGLTASVQVSSGSITAIP